MSEVCQKLNIYKFSNGKPSQSLFQVRNAAKAYIKYIKIRNTFHCSKQKIETKRKIIFWSFLSYSLII